MAERLVEMLFTLAGGLEKGKTFFYDADKDVDEVARWIDAGYARYVDEVDKLEDTLPNEGQEDVLPDVIAAPTAKATRTKVS